MYDFQSYHDIRQGNYNSPREIASNSLRDARNNLRSYLKRIAGKNDENGWGLFKSTIQEIYTTLSSPHKVNFLYRELERHISQLHQIQTNDIMQQAIKINIIRMLDELRDRINIVD